jgi:hypothetical protein
VDLGVDTKVVLLLAAAMFLWALLLGVMMYRQILESDEGMRAFMVALIVTAIGGWLVLVAGFLDAQIF